MKTILHFTCPKCHMHYAIDGYWKWILTSPFHWFRKRHTKCPICRERSWTGWAMIERRGIKL